MQHFLILKLEVFGHFFPGFENIDAETKLSQLNYRLDFVFIIFYKTKDFFGKYCHSG